MKVLSFDPFDNDDAKAEFGEGGYCNYRQFVRKSGATAIFKLGDKYLFTSRSRREVSGGSLGFAFVFVQNTSGNLVSASSSRDVLHEDKGKPKLYFHSQVTARGGHPDGARLAEVLDDAGVKLYEDRTYLGSVFAYLAKVGVITQSGTNTENIRHFLTQQLQHAEHYLLTILFCVLWLREKRVECFLCLFWTVFNEFSPTGEKP
jgi:hypothetical protein